MVTIVQYGECRTERRYRLSSFEAYFPRTHCALAQSKTGISTDNFRFSFSSSERRKGDVIQEGDEQVKCPKAVGS